MKANENNTVHPTAYIEKDIVIGYGAVIKPLSYVTAHVPPFTVVSGNPARWKKLTFFHCPPCEDEIREYYKIYYYKNLRLSSVFLQKLFDEFYNEIDKEYKIGRTNIEIMRFTGEIREAGNGDKTLIRVIPL